MKPAILDGLVKPMLLTLGISLGGGALAADGIFMRQEADGSVQLSNLPEGDDYKLLVAAPTPPAAPEDKAAAAPPAPDLRGQALAAQVAQYHDAVEKAARGAQVEPRLIHAVIAVESGYNPKAVSPKGAIGLMQVMPDTARRYGISDVRDPMQNLKAGARYLADLLKMFKNDLRLALAAYNAGENAVVRHGNQIPPYRETTDYVPKVLAVYRKLESLPI